MLIALLVTYAVIPQYEGTTKVMIEKIEQSDLTGQSRSARVDPEYYSTQFQLIKSRAVAKRVVKLLSLTENYDMYLNAAREKASLLQSIWLWLQDVATEALKALGS